jgi:lipopolysaccharide export system protein LptC
MMNSAKSAHRFRLSVIITLGAVMALGSFWLLEVMRKQISSVAPPTLHEGPDYSVEKFNFVRMAKSGQAQYLLSGAKLMHYAQNDVIDIQSLVAQSLSPNQAPVTMHADNGKLNQVNNTMQLRGNVLVTRPATAQSEGLQLKTETMLILMDDNVMQTDDPVEITMGQSVLTGVGMTGNNATGTFKLFSKVHAIYHTPGTKRR